MFFGNGMLASFFLSDGKGKKNHVKSLIFMQTGRSYRKEHTLCHFKTQTGSQSNTLQITSSFLIIFFPFIVL